MSNRIHSKRMGIQRTNCTVHIIIKEFMTTSDNLSEIVEKHYNKNEYLESVFLKVVSLFNLEEISERLYIELDRAIIKGHPDPQIFLLFIAVSLRFTSSRGQMERARAIYSIGASLSEKDLPVILNAYFAMQFATLLHYEGNISERDKLLKESISLVDQKSPRYRTFVYLKAAIMSEEGRLNEFSQKDLELIDNPINEKQAIHCDELKMKNFIFNGETSEGLKVLESYRKKFKGEYPPAQSFYQAFLLLSGDFQDTNYIDEPFQILAQTCRLLSSGNTEEAHVLCDLLKKQEWKKFVFIPFLKYLPLTIELSRNNKGMSRLLYQEIIQNGNTSYFDDFYLFRLLLCEGDRDRASELFNYFIDNVKKFGAENRLVFELQFAKDLKNSDIFLLTHKLNKNQHLNESKQVLKPKLQQNKVENGIQLLLGDSMAVRDVKGLVLKFANLKEPVLITGETGTGKELVARALHNEGVHFREPFLAINCGALTESLLQSELFGYVAGAFTGAQKEKKGIFEAAGKGTVFLDEFGEMSPKMQTVLLRVLENNEIRPIGGTATRKIECRIIVATNVDLKQAVVEKKFREDLYYRLTRFDIKIPPLRERKSDISLLAYSFLSSNNNSNNVTQILSEDLMSLLVTYDWPGNIRELKNEMERLKILHAEKNVINKCDFDFSRLRGFSGHSIDNSKVGAALGKKKANIQDLIRDTAHIANVLENNTKSAVRIQCFKELFLRHKKLTRSQIVKITLISPSTVTKSLKVLCKEGFVEKRKPNKSVNSHYFLLKE